MGWLYKSVQRVYMWGHCGALGKAAPLAPPAGWELLDTVGIRNDLKRCAGGPAMARRRHPGFGVCRHELWQ